MKIAGKIGGGAGAEEKQSGSHILKSKLCGLWPRWTGLTAEKNSGK